MGRGDEKVTSRMHKPELVFLIFVFLDLHIKDIHVYYCIHTCTVYITRIVHA